MKFWTRDHLLGKLICEFHFKDGNFRLGQGRIDFKKIRQALDTIGDECDTIR